MPSVILKSFCELGFWVFTFVCTVLLFHVVVKIRVTHNGINIIWSDYCNHIQFFCRWLLIIICNTAARENYCTILYTLVWPVLCIEENVRYIEMFILDLQSVMIYKIYLYIMPKDQKLLVSEKKKQPRVVDDSKRPYTKISGYTSLCGWYFFNQNPLEKQ